jgi:hypothetical protein
MSKQANLEQTLKNADETITKFINIFERYNETLKLIFDAERGHIMKNYVILKQKTQNTAQIEEDDLTEDEDLKEDMVEVKDEVSDECIYVHKMSKILKIDKIYSMLENLTRLELTYNYNIARLETLLRIQEDKITYLQNKLKEFDVIIEFEQINPVSLESKMNSIMYPDMDKTKKTVVDNENLIKSKRLTTSKTNNINKSSSSKSNYSNGNNNTIQTRSTSNINSSLKSSSTRSETKSETNSSSTPPKGRGEAKKNNVKSSSNNKFRTNEGHKNKIDNELLDLENNQTIKRLAELYDKKYG